MSTLGGLLVRGAAIARPGAGVVTPDARVPWSDVLAGAEGVAAELAEHGVGPGARVALLADNSVAGVRALFGIALLGAVSVPVNTRFAPPEIRHVLQDADVEAVLVTDDETAALHRAAAPRLPRLKLTGRVPVRAGPAVTVPVAGSDTAMMVYTSGTTSAPKGCPLTHDAVVGVARGVGRDRFRCTADDVLWDVLPLFHLSFVLPMLAVLDAGGTFVTDRRFDAARALAQIRDAGVTVAFTCFPTVIDALLERPDFADVFAGVRLMLNVGPPATLRAIQDRAPGTVQITSYGSSEVGGIAATTSPDDPDDVRLGTNGRPVPGTEIAVMAPGEERLLPDGETGEIVVRGAALSPGYWNAPEETTRTRTVDGWFRSGDLGSRDADGRVRYRGRLKEMIKVGGENVAALEVEAVLATHPAVVTAAVVGVPDRRLVEVPAAFVELRAPVDVDDLLAHCRAALADFKVPRHVRVVETWPMSATKIRKVELAASLAAELAEG